jgi:putative tributyrin esterase
MRATKKLPKRPGKKLFKSQCFKKVSNLKSPIFDSVVVTKTLCRADAVIKSFGVFVWILFLALPVSAQQPALTTDVVTIKFQSGLVKKDLPYNIVLPPGYAEKRRLRYPVLYLLHGLAGHYSDWTSRTKLRQYAAEYRLVIVTPEGNDGWYTDSVSTPTDKYETYIFQELIPDVQRRFRVYDTRAGRAVAGLSMGGYGALKFALKHPDVFSFAGSMSGALDAASWTATDLENLQSIFRSLEPVFGEAGNSTRLNNDLHRLYSELTTEQATSLPFLYLDCGTEDPFLSSTRNFSELLLSKKIPHEVRLLPGSHGWTYWNQQVGEVLRLAAKRLEPAK